MPNVEQEIKQDLHIKSNNSINAGNAEAVKKKKRPRIRNRIRNKSKVSNPDIPLEAVVAIKEVTSENKEIIETASHSTLTREEKAGVTQSKGGSNRIPERRVTSTQKIDQRQTKTPVVGPSRPTKLISPAQSPTKPQVGFNASLRRINNSVTPGSSPTKIPSPLDTQHRQVNKPVTSANSPSKVQVYAQPPQINNSLLHRQSSPQKSTSVSSRAQLYSYSDKGPIPTPIRIPLSPRKLEIQNNLKQTRVASAEQRVSFRRDLAAPKEVKTNSQVRLVKQENSLQKTSLLPKLPQTKTGPENKLQELLTIPANSTAETMVGPAEKTREQIMAEREAKKLAKQVKKTKVAGDVVVTPSSSIENSGKSAVSTKSQEGEIKQLINTSQAKNVREEKNNFTQQTERESKSSATMNKTEIDAPKLPNATEKSREQIKAEREAKKLAKQAAKAGKSVGGVAEITQQLEHIHLTEKAGEATTAAAKAQEVAQQSEKKKPALTKAERRAIQEAQRAAKAQAQAQPQKKTSTTAKPTTSTKPVPSTDKSPSPSSTPANISNGSNSTPSKSAKTNDCKVKLFNHLENVHQNVSLFVNNPQIHPSMARLGEQYAQRTVVGSNARCIAFLNALKMVIQDFETPPKKEFARSLEASIKTCVEHLHQCRPLAVSVSNAYKHIKHVLTQLPTDQPESELKENLCHFIETYIENQIGKAAQAISSSMQEKISNGDVILTFGCSSLINFICEEAHRRHVDFRVVVVDSRPFCEGQELLRRLTAKEIPCTYVLINAVGFVMPEVTKVLLGAHALLSNGYVMARAGTAQVALVARSFNVPVLVCCETHKFSERFQTDAIVYNELGDPDDLVMSDKCCLTNWQAKGKMSPLNLIYDITPPELVTAVVTEVSILPCTSVPVILRIKPTEIGYYS